MWNGLPTVPLARRPSVQAVTWSGGHATTENPFRFSPFQHLFAGGLPCRSSAAFNIVTYCSDFSELIPRNTVKGIRLFVTPTEYWELLWGIFAQVSGLQVNRELPNTVAAQYAIAMTGVTRIDDTPTLGCIKKPAGTNFWPATSS